MPDELKECPWCGCKAILRDFDSFMTVECRMCATSGPCTDTKQAAVAAWNTLPRKQKWTTYDGTEETLPMYGKLTLVEAKHGAKFAVYSYDFEIGDRWMHWPEDNYVE